MHDLRTVFYVGYQNPRIYYTEYLYDTDDINNTLPEIVTSGTLVCLMSLEFNRAQPWLRADSFTIRRDYIRKL